jgi:putative tryptophan/tyrosine transport system substrate-binding protein
LGWNEGQNLRVDVRWNASDAGLAQIYAAQLIGLMPDVILSASTINLTVIQEATSTVPVVFVQVSDPVVQGFVRNVRQPGGNLTGLDRRQMATCLRKLRPDLRGLPSCSTPTRPPQTKFFMQVIEAAAPSLGVQAITVPVRDTADIEPAWARFANQPNGGLILPTGIS